MSRGPRESAGGPSSITTEISSPSVLFGPIAALKVSTALFAIAIWLSA